MISAIHFLLQTLEEEGVTHIFGVPGGPLVPFYEALSERQNILPVLAKHEEGAAFMADGYARVHRGLGVCCATTGPGAMNALTGVASAYGDSIPLLFLGAQVSTAVFGKNALQDSSGGHWNINIVEMYRTATKLSVMLQNPQQMPHLLHRAIRTALTGRPGAVHLSLPVDLVKQSIVVDESSTSSFYSHAVTAGDPASIAQVASILQDAKHPVFFVGHGANLAGAWAPLYRIAEALHIPVATTLKGKGVFPEEHELSLGVFGIGGNALSDAYMLADEIDVLIIIGSGMGELQTHGWHPNLAHKRAIVQIDIDPLEIGKNYPVQASIVGDANAILTALADVLCNSNPYPHPQAKSYPLLDSLRAQEERFYQAETLQGDAPILKPQTVVAAMSEILPAETLLFVDNGNSLSWAGQYYVARQPGTIFCSMNVASMGYAIAAAIGGKMAAPERPVVALIGDGAFGMNGMELHTAVEYQVPVIWVVLNNGGHGMVYNGETLMNGKSTSTTVFRTPLDIQSIAQGLGVKALKATNLSEFVSTLQEALRMQEPCLIDATVDLEEVPRALRRRAATLNSFIGKKTEPHQEASIR
ncbi:thiamine pyrophosphate-binding protein [Dictyobacter arantiisoli]|uniref:Acetolactate synthase catalytic subunit n=1 Tax=Dictyobacter arantiisoli TaxID=2014874 RepID=A0A5A5TFW1_9CHLR|nr:thiamine pyrophosphate-binding protein [Dictyobacter arantiisoli]GCF10461.1 acetolactate synthase catalytic subunit [Dictyobacter arantiisoli]